MINSVPLSVLGALTRLHAAGYEAHLVGGCVRDLLRGAKPKDYDIATNAWPEQVTPLFEKVIPTGIKHGTVTAVLGDQSVEITTYRSDGAYEDGRRPSDVKFESDITFDLARRDFTVNAIAWDPTTDTFIDPFGGRGDIEKKNIKCVGDPFARFAEDGLRCIRAVRFFCTLGFTIASKTYDAIGQNVETFKLVSMERKQTEFNKILMSEQATDGLTILNETGLMAAICPEFTGSNFHVIKKLSVNMELRIAALLCTCRVANVEDLLRRLKFSNASIDKILKLFKHQFGPIEKSTDKSIREMIKDVGRGMVELQMELCVALAGQTGVKIDVERTYALRDAPNFPAVLALNGHEVQTILGLQRPGSKVGTALAHLNDIVLYDPTKNTKEDLTRILGLLYDH